MSVEARIEGAGVVGPGLASWDATRRILAGNAPYAPGATKIPAPESLPAVERRRAGTTVRLALAAGLAAVADAGRSAAELAAVFASSTGDGDNLHAICETLASGDPLISPTRFHNSVHNAPSGYWGIATGARHAADSLAAFDASFGAGLLEAAARLRADPRVGVLLIAYDAPYPEPLHATRAIPDSFGVALVLGASERGVPIRIELVDDAHDTLDDPALESLRRSIPAARALPLLAALARGKGRVVIEYLDDLSIAVTVGDR
ncbi:MAG TPA: beta-ketoacyl synthase chain length factor [Usitatibacter sp.]|nr:beta-ketoacyl synthase chain length factor [Usitatibacter sp.]